MQSLPETLSAHLAPPLVADLVLALLLNMRGQTPSSKIWLMPRLGWSAPLTRLIQVKDGPALRTLNDAREYMLDHLPEADQARQSWQKAAELLLAAADGLDDVGAATGQVELAIFLQAQVGAAKD